MCVQLTAQRDGAGSVAVRFFDTSSGGGGGFARSLGGQSLDRVFTAVRLARRLLCSRHGGSALQKMDEGSV